MQSIYFESALENADVLLCPLHMELLCVPSRPGHNHSSFLRYHIKTRRAGHDLRSYRLLTILRGFRWRTGHLFRRLMLRRIGALVAVAPFFVGWHHLCEHLALQFAPLQSDLMTKMPAAAR